MASLGPPPQMNRPPLGRGKRPCAFKRGLVLPRARGFTARLEPKKAYRLEGGLRGGWLVVERAYPLGKWDLHRKGKRPAPEAIEGDRNPYLELDLRGLHLHR
jgi:hypothetical protein